MILLMGILFLFLILIFIFFIIMYKDLSVNDFAVLYSSTSFFDCLKLQFVFHLCEGQGVNSLFPSRGPQEWSSDSQRWLPGPSPTESSG